MKKSFSILLFTLVVLAVQAKEIKPQDETIADTYWRNEATGDWFIGFAPKHVIYNNKVWNIATQTEKDGSYMLKLDNGTVIKVSKFNNNLRSITIGNEKPVSCTPITTTALPDYPTISETAL